MYIYIYIIYRIPDACLISGCVSGCLRYSGCVSGCLPCAPLCYLASGGSKISNKITFSGLGLGILPPAGQRSQEKHVPGRTLWPPLGYLASGWSKISNKTRPRKNSHIWDIYIHIYIYIYIYI